MTDILILGGGPAGLTAALYAARAGKSVIVCEKEGFGGQITQAHQVDNLPGLPGISGLELGDKLCSQAMDAGVQTAFCEVVGIHHHIDGTFYVETDDGPMNARTVIFAGGAKPRMLGVAREEDLIGSGISYCALCDGAFFQNQDVAVIGGGNTAFSDALVLAGICRSVTIVHRRDSFRAEEAVVQAVKNTPNIKLMTPYTVSELVGEEQVEGIVLNDGTTVPVQAVFVALGRVPDCSLIETLVDLDEAGYVIASESCMTKTPGLFVAGDCRQKTIRQLTTAMADGTVAAMAACEFLK
ncbi:MAG: FAD-dependent oxidoreductase [Oscillospiraceae bacterium]|nr:FAD-dependent oxidoreductase [Oscillospiraceae bacterium]